MKAIFFIVLSLSISSAFADCSSFIGNYFVTSEGCVAGHPNQMSPDFQWSRLSIAYQATSQKLKMAYNPHTGGYVADYIADGKEQTGDDMNSGARYTASCSGDTLSIRRKFSQIRLPMITTMTAKDGVFEYVESVEGDDWVRICKFARGQ